MMWTSARPPESWSSVESPCAATVGNAEFGRTATTVFSVRVAARTVAASAYWSALAEAYGIRV